MKMCSRFNHVHLCGLYVYFSGEQLKIGLVQMIPLVDSVNKNYFIPRIFPPLREVNPSFSLYPAFGLARLSESPFAEQKDEEIKVPSVGNNEIVV